MGKIRLDPGPFVLPMPTVLVGAAVDGKPSFMTAALVRIANFKPPIVVCGPSPTHQNSVAVGTRVAPRPPQSG